MGALIPVCRALRRLAVAWFQGTHRACAISRWFMLATARDVPSTLAIAMLFDVITHHDAPALRENLALSCNIQTRAVTFFNLAA
jgi:hypothetical protein